MESVSVWLNQISRKQLLLSVFLFFYAALGINTEFQYIDRHPTPASLLADYEVYKKSIKTALKGENPYDNDFRYAPPALLVIEVFYHIPDKLLQDAIYTAANIALLILIVYGIGRFYNLTIAETWYWYPLALFLGPVFEQLHVGQINIISEFGIFILFVAGSALPILAGLGLSLAVITKVTPAALVLYLIATKNYRAILAAVAAIAILAVIAGLRYGFVMYPMYVANMGSMLDTFHASSNSQSLFSKLVTNGLVSDSVELNPTGAQHVLDLYVGLLFLASTALSYFNQRKEALFIVLGLGAMLVPNWMWYHHYVFFIVPLFIWIASSGQDLRVIVWCLLGMLVMQLDRWYLTTGLLIHIFGHITILVVLSGQAREALQTIAVRRASPAV